MSKYNVVGKRTPREESVPKVKGEAVYTVDITLPGMLYGKMLTSPHAHAKILGVDTSRAMRLQGVKAVLTAKDIPDRSTVKAFSPLLRSDVTGMARDKVCYIGDIVAAVAAIDEDTAEEALGLIDVDYEILPAVFDPEEAMQPDAIRIHDHSEHNIPAKALFEYGDVEKGFRDSDYVREDTFRLPAIAYCHAETQNAVVNFDPISGVLTAWVAAQAVSSLQNQLANLLGMPWTKVRVIAPYVGGGFGGRLSAAFQCPFLAAVLSLKTERPVKIVYTREEDFSTYWSAMHQVVITLKTGVKKDGTLMAREATVIYDSGAYRDAVEGPTPQAYIAGLHMPYKIPNIKLTGISVYTNKQPVGPFRGNGQHQTVWASELQMEMIAKELRIDPVEMRVANAVQPNTITPLGWGIGSCGLTECIRKAAQAINWDDQGVTQPAAGRGRGLGASWFPSGFIYGGTPDNPLPATVRINADGTADLSIIGSDSGSGQHSTLRMIVAEELGIPLENVKRLVGDSNLFPNEMPPITVTISCLGRPALMAALKAKQMLLETVAKKIEANVTDLESKDGRISVKGSPDKGMSFAEAARMTVTERGPIVSRGDAYSQLDQRAMYERYLRFSHPGRAEAFSFGAAAAEVEVDKETGNVRILQLAHAYDVGFAVNPLEVEAQLQGGAAMSISRLLGEELIHDNGQIMNPSFLNYKMLTAVDMPRVIPIIVEGENPRDGDGPYGAKELGMGALSSSGSAVINGIYNAIGVEIKEFPLTPERILKALEGKK